MVALLVLMACRADRNDDLSTGADGYMRLTFSRLETRAEMASDGSGTFSDGDRIGLYIDNGSEVQYRELTYQGGEWMPRLKRSDFGAGVNCFFFRYVGRRGRGNVVE